MRRLDLFIVTLLALAPNIANCDLDLVKLPALQSATHNNDQTEVSLGRAFLRQLRGSSPTIEDPLLQAYLEDLCYRLAFINGGLPATPLQIALLPDRSINAFAVPGGVIGVNAGLFLYANNEAELASVLAHELGHISQHHYMRSQQDNSNNQWLYLGAILASIALAAHSNNNNAGLALGMSTQAALIQQQLAYSRQHEREADRVGLQTLAAAGYNPQAMPDFFTRMDKETRMVGFIPDFVLTHPLTSERIADTLLMARQYPTQGMLDRPAYELARIRLLSQLNKVTDHDIETWQHQLAERPQDKMLRLGLVMGLIAKKNYEQARQQLQPLIKSDANAIEVLITQADIELAANNPNQALTILQQGLLVTPDSVPLRLYAAKAANQANQSMLTINWLEPLSRNRPDDPLVWQLLADAYLQQKDAINVLRCRAENLFLHGQTRQALEALQQANRLAGNNYQLSAHIQNQMTEWQNELATAPKMN